MKIIETEYLHIAKCVLCSALTSISQVDYLCEAGSTRIVLCGPCVTKVQKYEVPVAELDVAGTVVRLWLHGKLCGICSWDSGSAV